MQAVLGFLRSYETLIYIFLGVAFLLYALRTLNAWRALQNAIFGLERIQAEQRLRRGALGMGLTFTATLIVFVMATYVEPYQSAIILPTATANILGTPASGTPATAEATLQNTPTPVPPPKIDTQGCVPGQIEITQPQSGDTISGEVNIEGSALIPDFGFYKVDIAPIEQALFLTIYASHTPVKNGKLVENWDTTTIPPGDYVLQLVVVDTEGKALPPCRLRIHIAAPQD
ncbi:MAG: hypothetical protein GXO56_08310 [Chloroflexi bacterium]|nr:hypothetical protein [Chloroflexota bacterium]